MPANRDHERYPYLTEEVNVSHVKDPGVLLLPVAGVTGAGADSRHTARIKVAREQYRRVVTVNFRRAKAPPVLPPAAYPEPGEIEVSNTVALTDPDFDASGQPVYVLAGTVIFGRESGPPASVQYPKSPLRDEDINRAL
jgi:hypothetical protein